MIKVVIVEDNDTIRKGLKLLINNSSGFSCKWDFPDFESMMEISDEINPDVMLIDVDLPGISGIEGIRIIKNKLPGLVVLVLLVYKESEKLYEALCAGACGYIEKKSPQELLLSSIQSAAAGNSPMSAQIALKIQGYFLQKKNNSESKMLSSIERSILQNLISGNNYQAIANKMSLNVDIVQQQFRSIYEKLQFHMNSEKSSENKR